MNADKKNRLLIVTGLSGAGLSTALKALEDLGYHTHDNLPLFLLDPLLKNPPVDGRPLAMSIDCRTRDFDAQAVLETMEVLKGLPGCDAKLLFITADVEKIARRYTETRRPHPMAKDRSVMDGIHAEKALLSPLLNAADYTVDTTLFLGQDLKRHLSGIFNADPKRPSMTIALISFSYKIGLPRDADCVTDMRFLKNPHWDDALRDLNGTNKEVGNYINTDPRFQSFKKNFQGLMGDLIPAYKEEGKSYLTLAFGCSGGKHRSVYTVEEMAQWFRDNGIAVTVQHRDLK